jgi:hypothetical protein
MRSLRSHAAMLMLLSLQTFSMDLNTFICTMWGGGSFDGPQAGMRHHRPYGRDATIKPQSFPHFFWCRSPERQVLAISAEGAEPQE